MTIDVTPETRGATRLPERGATLALLVPLFLATLAGLVALWPSADALAEREAQIEEMSGWHTRTLRATLIEDLEPAPGTVEVRLDEGSAVLADPSQILALEGLEAGTPVIVMATAAETWTEGEDEPAVEVQYWIQDVDRSPQMRVLAIAAAIAVTVCALGRGVRALVVLAVAGVLTWFFLVPRLMLADATVWAIAVLAAAVCLTASLATYGPRRRGAIMAWAMVAGTAAIAAVGWLVIDYVHLNTGLSIGSTAYYYYLDGMEEPGGLYLTAGVLAGLATLSVVVAEQVRIVTAEHAPNRWGPLRLIRAGAPTVQRSVLVAGLLGLAFLLGPLLARHLASLPGVGLHYSSDVELGLVLIVCASLGLAIASPITAGAVLALDRLTRAAGPAPTESAETPEEPPASARAADLREDDAATPGLAVTEAVARTGPLPPSGTAPPPTPHPGELQPAPRERPDSAYRRPRSAARDEAAEGEGGAR